MQDQDTAVSNSPLEGVLTDISHLTDQVTSPVEAVIAAPATGHYAADNTQSFTCLLEDSEAAYEVTHVFGPLLDDLLFKLDERRDTRITKAKTKGAMATKTDTTEANAALWDALITSVRGYGAPGEPLPDNWKALVPPGDKSEVIDLLLTAEAVEPETKEKAAFRAWGSAAAPKNKVISLRCYFSGQEVLTEHVLLPNNAQLMKAYRKITSEVYFVKGARLGKRDTQIPPQLARKCALYDEIQVSASGYIGRVPAHHKQAVVDAYFETEADIAGKN